MTSNQRNSISNNLRRYFLGVLVVTYTLNFVDRQILAILLEPIKTDMGFSDTGLGFLTGFGFALFYVLMGIPVAMWADRGNRRNIVAISLAIWSLMTALCGTVQNFWQLAVARVGVGIGEAGCSPPSHSMISDLYGPERRATALAVYALGVPLGVWMGYLIGGWVNQWFGWRVAFFVVGIPGLVLALVLRFTLPEPSRGSSERRHSGEDAPPLADVIRFLLRRPAFLHMLMGGSLAAFFGYIVLGWMPSFLIRTHGMSTGEVGTLLGLILGIPGVLGIMLGGYLADFLGSRDQRWYLWIVSVALLCAMPFYVGVFLSDEVGNALWFLVAPVVLGNFYQATTFSQTQGLVPLRVRALAAAIMLFVLNVIGLGLGPLAVGMVSDMLEPALGADSLRYSLLIFTLAGGWAAFHYYMAGRHLQRDLARADEWPEKQRAQGTIVENG